MFTPVSPAEYFQSPAGEQYQATLLDPSADPAHRDRIAHWQTGNYDPKTGLQTVYRAVDEVRLHAFMRTGAVTSRVVEHFGQGDIYTAIDALHDAADGNIPLDVVARLQPDYDKAAAYVASRWTEEPVMAPEDERSFAEVTDFLSGTPSKDTREHAHSVASLLEVAAGLGKKAYIAASLEAAKDDTPLPHGVPNAVDMRALLHSSIHTTTSHDYATGDNGLRNYSNRVLKIDFKPGSLPIAPRIGYVDGKLINTSAMKMDSEEEWYGVGQLKAGDDVKISVLEDDPTKS